jgi:hypothetical protein
MVNARLRDAELEWVRAAVGGARARKRRRKVRQIHEKSTTRKRQNFQFGIGEQRCYKKTKSVFLTAVDAHTPRPPD